MPVGIAVHRHCCWTNNSRRAQGTTHISYPNQFFGKVVTNTPCRPGCHIETANAQQRLDSSAVQLTCSHFRKRIYEGGIVLHVRGGHTRRKHMGILRSDDVLGRELHLGCARTQLLSSCKTFTNDDRSSRLLGSSVSSACCLALRDGLLALCGTSSPAATNRQRSQSCETS